MLRPRPRRKRTGSARGSTLAEVLAPQCGDWDELLDELEAGCARLAAALHVDAQLVNLDFAAWKAPDSGRALPARLRQRAAEVLEQLGGLMEAYSRRKADVAAQLKAVDSVPRTPPGSAVYLDELG